MFLSNVLIQGHMLRGSCNDSFCPSLLLSCLWHGSRIMLAQIRIGRCRNVRCSLQQRRLGGSGRPPGLSWLWWRPAGNLQSSSCREEKGLIFMFRLKLKQRKTTIRSECICSWEKSMCVQNGRCEQKLEVSISSRGCGKGSRW